MPAAPGWKPLLQDFVWGDAYLPKMDTNSKPKCNLIEVQLGELSEFMEVFQETGMNEEGLFTEVWVTPQTAMPPQRPVPVSLQPPV